MSRRWLKRRVAVALLSALGLLWMALAGPPALAQTKFLEDTFTDTNGTNLQNHNPDTGDAASWVEIDTNAGNLEIQSNTLRQNSGAIGSRKVYKNTTAPGSAEYVVAATFTFSTSTNVENKVQLLGRKAGDLATGDHYTAILDASGGLDLVKRVSGTDTSLGTTTVTVTLGTALVVRLVITNRSKKVTVDGVEKLSSTDNAITATGVSGIAIKTRNTASASEVVADNFGGSTFAATEVRLRSFEATDYGGGRVLVQWRTGFEVENLGFHLYREEGGQRVRITPELVAGSALFAGAGTPLTAGKAYTWWDFVPPRGGPVSYWLEDVALNGQRTWHGPVTPVHGGSLPADWALPSPGGGPLLSQVGRDGPAAALMLSSLPSERRARPAVPTPESLQIQWAWPPGPPSNSASSRRAGTV